MPDYVETVLYPNEGLPAGDPNDAADDGRDTDNGGVSDYDELKLGTDPTDPTDDTAGTTSIDIWLPIIYDRHNDCSVTMTCVNVAAMEWSHSLRGLQVKRV